MVVIQPSTGDILAIANNDNFNDFALTAAVAPGSSFKVITSTALFNNGILSSPQSPVSCPPTFKVQGITYHNDQNESEPAGTPFITDFAQSCNNAFDQFYGDLYGKLASTAKDYYGLDQKWDIGLGGNITGSYMNVPATASGAELAQETWGEGQLAASPLAMASVAATVENGSFKQPILTAGTKQATASALPAATDNDLKEMMRAVVTSGTADDHRLRPDRLRQDRDGRRRRPGAAQQLADRLRPDQGRRGGRPRAQRRLRRPVRGPRGPVLPRLLLRLAGSGPASGEHTG